MSGTINYFAVIRSSCTSITARETYSESGLFGYKFHNDFAKGKMLLYNEFNMMQSIAIIMSESGANFNPDVIGAFELIIDVIDD